MEKKMKSIIAILVVTIAVSTFLIIPSAFAEGELEEQEIQCGLHPRKRFNKFRILLYFLRNGVPSEFEAKIVALEEHILIVEIEGSFMNLIMPGKWIVDQEVYRLPDLFDIGQFGAGNTIEINSLKIEMEQDTHTVNAYFVYEVEVDETTASAILPFNVEVE